MRCSRHKPTAPTELDCWEFQSRVSSLAGRLVRRSPGLSMRLAHRAAERCLCAGVDPLAMKLPEDYQPHVCPDCYAVNAPCHPGCWEAEREERAQDERDRGLCRGCGAEYDEPCSCPWDEDDCGSETALEAT